MTRHPLPPGISQELIDAVDRELDSDRTFFRRHPERSYRVRPAFTAELSATLAVAGHPPFTQMPSGHHACVAVKQVASGIRLRVSATLSAPIAGEVPEDNARWLYETLAAAWPKIQEVEKALRSGGEAS
jgi:hypothetical protein